MKSNTSLKVFVAGALLPVALGVGIVIAASSGGADPTSTAADQEGVTVSTLESGATVGPMEADRKTRPEFVPALGRDGEEVGYVRSDEIEPVSADGELLIPSPKIDVYAVDGRTVVGQMIADIGFVSSADLAAGKIPDPIPVQTYSGQSGE